MQKGTITIATKTDGGWLINGDKMFITLAREAGFHQITARTGSSDARGENLTVFIADTDRGKADGTVYQHHPKLGQGGSPLYQITYNNFFVPDNAILGGPDMLNRGWEILEATLGHSRAEYIGAQGVGTAQASLEEAIMRSKIRRMQGERPLIEKPMAYNLLTVMNRQTVLARKIVQIAAQYADAGHPKAVVVGALAKLVACTTGLWAAIESNHLHGGEGYLPETSPRSISLVLDSLVMPVYEGAPPVQMGILVKNGFGPEFYRPMLAPPLDVGYIMNPDDIMRPDVAKKQIVEHFPLIES